MNATPAQVSTGIEDSLEAQPIDINAIALRHYQYIFDYLGLEGSCHGYIFSGISVFTMKTKLDLFEFNIITGHWSDHGEDVTGVGILSLMSHVMSYTDEEALVVLKEWLGDLSITGLNCGEANLNGGSNA